MVRARTGRALAADRPVGVEGAFEHAEHSLHLGNEVGVAGRVDQVDREPPCLTQGSLAWSVRTKTGTRKGGDRATPPPPHRTSDDPSPGLRSCQVVTVFAFCRAILHRHVLLPAGRRDLHHLPEARVVLDEVDHAGCDVLGSEDATRSA